MLSKSLSFDAMNRRGDACLRSSALDASTFAPSGSSAILRNASRTALTVSAGAGGGGGRGRIRKFLELHQTPDAIVLRWGDAPHTSAVPSPAARGPCLSSGI